MVAGPWTCRGRDIAPLVRSVDFILGRLGGAIHQFARLEGVGHALPGRDELLLDLHQPQRANTPAPFLSMLLIASAA